MPAQKIVPTLSFLGGGCSFSYASFHNASANQGGRAEICVDGMGTEATFEEHTVQGAEVEGAGADVVRGWPMVLFPNLEALPVLRCTNFLEFIYLTAEDSKDTESFWITPKASRSSLEVDRCILRKKFGTGRGGSCQCFSNTCMPSPKPQARMAAARNLD